MSTEPAPNEINRGIAVGIGWRQFKWRRGQHSYYHWLRPGEYDPDVYSEFFSQRCECLNCFHSLEACREAELALTGEQYIDYLHELKTAVHRDSMPVVSLATSCAESASSEQRARALHTLLCGQKPNP